MADVFQNQTEEFVFRLCRCLFLSLWSYANPRREGSSKELCDMLVVCEPHIVIFSVKNCILDKKLDPKIGLKRWWKKAIDNSVKQLYGAEKNLAQAQCVTRNDGKAGLPLPSLKERKIHRISVSLGARGRVPIPSVDFGKGFVHIWDESFLDVVMHELDTIIDFVNYLDAKERLAENYSGLIIEGGEQNLLAIYLLNDRNFPEEQPSTTLKGNFWNEFKATPKYRCRMKAQRVSYIWDRLLENIGKDVLEDRMEFGRALSENEQVLRYMAHESRFERRCLSESFKEFFQLAKACKIHARMMFSYSGIGYVFFAPPPEYDRQTRIAELGIRCFIARNELPDCITVIGIGINVERAPKGFATDLYLFSAPVWTKENRQRAEQMKASLNIFKNLREKHVHYDEYPK